ncbi:ATP-binding protein [Kribbella catacumbae]|uniref:ATP-binding protein n=1 Tax=Kribbella catacumbae TaxID=460086 RepID=UPI00035CA925|nr:ATP-binding protein [Kribbella catacumbae]
MSRAARLRIGVQTIGQAVVVSPSGVLDVATAPQLRTFLTKQLAEQPAAVVVLLHDLLLAKAHTLSVFTTVARQTAEWSGIPLILVTSRHHDHQLQLHTAAVARFIPVFDNLASALASMNNPPVRQLTRLRLAPEPSSPGVARRYVAATCELWRCEDIAEDAVAIVSELTANVVRHARTDAVLRLELRRQLLTVAISDDSPTFPVRPPTEDWAENGRGLGIVRALSTAWGANPTISGGKIVWATIRVTTPSARAAINNGWRNGK